MTLGRRIAAPTIVGLAVVVIGLRVNAMISGLCFRTALPLDAGNGFQGATTTVTLSFGASGQAAIP